MEEPDPGVQAVLFRDPEQVRVGIDAVRIAAARGVIGQRLAEAAADVEDADALRDPAERGSALPLEPASEAVELDLRLEIVEAAGRPRVVLAVQRAQLVVGEGRPEDLVAACAQPRRVCLPG